MKKFYKTISFAGVGILRANQLLQLQRIEEDVHNLMMQLAFRHGASVDNVKSQIGQDLFVLYLLNWKKNGYFVEFGATNGFDLSNTYLLEKDFGWTGILVEPAKVWHDDLKKNRSSIIDFDCVWKESNQLLRFKVVTDPVYSTLTEFSRSDEHHKNRRFSSDQIVKTVSLNDLLERHGSPAIIDYLSIDTEGSELEILQSLDFSRYNFRVITCEHNFSPQREDIYSLLTENGYIRVFEGLSRWDDWYLKRSNLG
jgi:FkbM family methyltransferase